MMRYINSHFTYLLTYLLTQHMLVSSLTDEACDRARNLDKKFSEEKVESRDHTDTHNLP